MPETEDGPVGGFGGSAGQGGADEKYCPPLLCEVDFEIPDGCRGGTTLDVDTIDVEDVACALRAFRDGTPGNVRIYWGEDTDACGDFVTYIIGGRDDVTVLAGYEEDLGIREEVWFTARLRNPEIYESCLADVQDEPFRCFANENYRDEVSSEVELVEIIEPCACDCRCQSDPLECSE